jgi:hypothetical protein
MRCAARVKFRLVSLPLGGMRVASKIFEVVSLMLNTIKNWIINHDDKKLFVVLYISLAVILSIWLGLFWLCVVVGVHYLFEVIIQMDRKLPVHQALALGVWEVKLDIFLIILALLVSIYMDVILGAAGLSAGARTVATAGARFAGWQRLIRVVLLSVDDLAQAIRGFLPRKKADAGKAGEASATAATPPGLLTKGDYASLTFGALCIFFLFAAPLFTDHTLGDVFQIVLADLRP